MFTDRLTPLPNGTALNVRRPDSEPEGTAVPFLLVPFLLVHGLASNVRLWDGVASALAQHGHPVAAVDLRGHGRSDKPDDGYDMATVADDVALLIDELGWERPAVAGQSWGGNVVMELAYRHPDAIGMIAAVDGGCIDLRGRFPRWEDCSAALAPPSLAGTPRTEIERRLRDCHPDWPDRGIEGTLANFAAFEDGTVAPWLTCERHMLVLRGLWEHDVRTRFAGVEAPVLLLPADTGDSAWTTDKEAVIEAALAALPRGRVHWFRPADHDVHAQHPVEVALVLHQAAAELVGGGR